MATLFIVQTKQLSSVYEINCTNFIECSVGWPRGLPVQLPGPQRPGLQGGALPPRIWVCYQTWIYCTQGKQHYIYPTSLKESLEKLILFKLFFCHLIFCYFFSTDFRLMNRGNLLNRCYQSSKNPEKRAFLLLHDFLLKLKRWFTPI